MNPVPNIQTSPPNVKLLPPVGLCSVSHKATTSQLCMHIEVFGATKFATTTPTPLAIIRTFTVLDWTICPSHEMYDNCKCPFNYIQDTFSLLYQIISNNILKILTVGLVITCAGIDCLFQ